MRRLTFASDTSSTLRIPGIRTLHRREATKVESAMGIEFWVSVVPTPKYDKGVLVNRLGLKYRRLINFETLRLLI